jgi:hypothetical protein
MQRQFEKPIELVENGVGKNQRDASAHGAGKRERDGFVPE